jgi:O-antigen ligase
MILIAFLVFLFQHKLSWLKEFRSNPFFWPALLLLIIAAFSVFISPDISRGAGIWKAYYLESIIFYIMLISTIKSKKQLQNIFIALGISAVYLSLISFWQFFSGWNMPLAFLNPDGSVDRVVSILGYPNALGLYLGPIIILFTGFLLWQKDTKLFQLLKLAVIALGFITIILAESEAAILSIIGIWFLWGLINKKSRYYFIALIILAILVFFFIPQVSDYLLEKLLLQDYSGFIRRLIWQESFQMLSDNWFFGAGLAGYQTRIAPYHLPTFEIFLYPHNIILNFWSELGLMGLLVFVFIFAKFLWKNLKSYLKNKNNLLNLTLFLVIIQMLIHGLVDAPYLKNDLSVLFWIIIAIYTINKNT